MKQSYPHYVLALLVAVAVFSYMDRSIVAILQISISESLSLSDTQMGVIIGVAFALFYMLCAIPIARLGDHGNRSRILAVILAVWSAATMLCGAAAGFVTLFLARVGVAVGEAGGAPLMQSLISDYFSRRSRATAIAIWSMAGPVGSMLGLLLGGLLDASFGWRATFFIMGAAGLLLVPLLIFTLKEPRRGAVDNEISEAGAGKPPPFGQSMAILWRLKSLRFLLLAAAFQAYGQNASLTWLSPFYNRSFGLSVDEIGLALGLIGGGGAIAGTFLGGILADRAGRGDLRWYAWTPGLASALFCPVFLLLLFTPFLVVSLVALFFAQLLINSYIGPVMAAGQTMAQPNLRALVASVTLLVVSLFGAMLGPLLTGVISDALAQAGAANGLTQALGVAGLVPLAGAGLYYLAGRDIRRDMAPPSPVAGDEAAGAA